MKKRKINSAFLRYFLKVSTGLLFFFIFRLAYVDQNESVFHLDKHSWFYLIYTVVLVFIIWEVNDLCYRVFNKRFGRELFTLSNIIKYQVIVLFSTALTLLLGMYFLHFKLAVWLECEWEDTPLNYMLEDYYRSQIIALFFNIVYLNINFIKYKQKADLSEEQIKKENILFQYESLRNQIDPHFLFNCFSVLNTLIETDSKLASSFLNHLSELYRYVLDNKENNLITVRKELECSNSFLSLMKIRHEGCLRSEITLDKETLELKIPTMSLQMLIENAIKHNSFNENNPLIIQVSNEGSNYLIVTNKLNTRQTNKISAGIGLKNIQNRYDHYSKQKVLIMKTDGIFQVKLPLLMF